MPVAHVFEQQQFAKCQTPHECLNATDRNQIFSLVCVSILETLLLYVVPYFCCVQSKSDIHEMKCGHSFLKLSVANSLSKI